MYSWKYVLDLKDVDGNRDGLYRPFSFKNQHKLLQCLAQKIVINQTDYNLTCSEIELLALGLNFIPEYGISNELKYGKHASYYCEQHQKKRVSVNRCCSKRGLLPCSFSTSCQDKPNFNQKSLLGIYDCSIYEDKSVYFQSIFRPITQKTHNKPNYAEQLFSTKYSAASSAKFKENTGNNEDKEKFHVSKIANKLLSQTNIYVVQSDKGGCSVLWKVEEYEMEAFRHLDDESQYRCLNVQDKSIEISSSFSRIATQVQEKFVYPSTITGQPLLSNREHSSKISQFSLFNEEHLLEKIISERDNLIDKLGISGFLLKDEIIAMKSVIGQIPYVFFRPKVHKIPRSAGDRIRGRPVVTACSGPLFLLDKYLARLTSPVLIVTAGSLSNTQEIVTYLSSAVLSGQARCSTNHEISSKWMGFATADVVSLYSSIPIENGILAAVEVYTLHFWRLCKRAEEEQLYRPIDPPLFEIALRLVVENSYINFQNKFYYHQIKGAAMGSCISAYFANSYMYLLTRTVVERPPGWLRCFQRYVDDFLIFCCFHPSHGNDHLQNLFKSISNNNIAYEINLGQNDTWNTSENLNSSISFDFGLQDNSIPRNCFFLDVQFGFDHIENHLHFRPIFNRFTSSMILHRSSRHSPFLFKNIPYSQLVRMHKLSSSRKIFLEAVKPFKKFLIARGYGEGEIRRSVQRVERNKSFSYTSHQNFSLCEKKIHTENASKESTIYLDQLDSYVHHVSRHTRCSSRHHPYSDGNSLSETFQRKIKTGRR